MKKNLTSRLMALVLVIVSLFSISAVALADTTKYVNVTPNVNFRKTPGGALIDRIPYGASVTEHSTLTYNNELWSYVTYNTQTGYVMSKFLSSTAPGGDSSNLHPTTAAQAFGTYTLQSGQTSYYIKNVQMALNHLGYNAGVLDGKFGTNTLNAVIAFQTQNTLQKIDGKVGPETRAKLWELAHEYLQRNGVLSLNNN